MIAFRLSMPGVNSWNGRWSGEGREYVKILSLGRSKAAAEAEAAIVADGYFYYSFGDGWAASVSATLVEPAEARRLRRVTADAVTCPVHGQDCYGIPAECAWIEADIAADAGADRG